MGIASILLRTTAVLTLAASVTLVAPPANAAVLAPTSTVVTRGADDVVNVEWDVPGGQTATSYIVRAYTTEAGSVTWDVCAATGTSRTTCNDGDILIVPRTQEAWIAVEATDGTTTATTSPRIKVNAAPAAPSTPTLASIDGGLEVAWTWAAEGVGVTATNFTATAYESASGGAAVGSACTSASSPCTITGLVNGTTYFVDVVANGATEQSRPSARASAQPKALPSAPTHIDVQGGDTTLIVTWSAPENSGGNPITSYQVDAYTSATGGAVVASCQPATVTSFRCTLEGLTNGTPYFVEVSAANLLGSGPVSSRVESKPGSRPTAPRGVSVVRGDGTLEVSWLAPVSDGGSPVTRYTARAYATSTSPTVIASCTATGLECRISGVANASTYYVNVTATSLVGDGPPSTRVISRQSSAPSSPRSVAAVRGDGFAHVTWRAPESTNGSLITKYVARAFDQATGGNPIAGCSPLGTALRCDLGPLPNGSNYYIDVIAVTARFTSEPSSPRVPVLTGVAPSPPRAVTVQQIGRDLVVRWRVPSTDGGQPIREYTATAFNASNGMTSRGTCTTSGDSCAIEQLSGAPVYVSVTATSSLGTSAPSAPRQKVTINGAPSEPRQVSARQVNRRVTISWLRSLDDGDTPITGYRAVVRDSRGEALGSCSKPTPKGPISTRIDCTVSNVPVNGLKYVTVVASNSQASADSRDVYVSQARVSTPRDLEIFPAERRLAVTAARATSDTPQTRYIFRAWAKGKGGKVVSSCIAPSSAAQPNCNLVNLANYAPVWIDVIARNGTRSSKPTSRIRAVPMASAPSAPRDVTVAVMGSDLRVRWQLPLSDGGYPITKTVATVTSDVDGESVLGSCEAKGRTTQCTVTGLTAEYVYVTVQSANPVGEGSRSVPMGRNR